MEGVLDYYPYLPIKDYVLRTGAGSRIISDGEIKREGRSSPPLHKPLSLWVYLAANSSIVSENLLVNSTN
jgi:hypothetical protein